MASNTSQPIDDIPEGYVVCTHDGQKYLVPKFMHEATQQSLDAHQKRLDLGVHTAPGGVSTSFQYLSPWPDWCRCRLRCVPVPTGS
jgi:hypothetical protein